MMEGEMQAQYEAQIAQLRQQFDEHLSASQEALAAQGQELERVRQELVDSQAQTNQLQQANSAGFSQIEQMSSVHSKTVAEAVETAQAQLKAEAQVVIDTKDQVVGCSRM
jgi:hypothetical protein